MVTEVRPCIERIPDIVINSRAGQVTLALAVQVIDDTHRRLHTHTHTPPEQSKLERSCSRIKE